MIRKIERRDARLRYPSMYYTADKRGKISLVWSRSTSDNSEPPSIVPQFTQADPAPNRPSPNIYSFSLKLIMMIITKK